MRRSASEVIRELEMRVAQLEKASQVKDKSAFEALLDFLDMDLESFDGEIFHDKIDEVGVLFDQKVKGKRVWIVRSVPNSAVMKKHKGKNYLIHTEK